MDLIKAFLIHTSIYKRQNNIIDKNQISIYNKKFNKYKVELL